MKDYTDKKAGSGIGSSRRGSKLVPRDPNHEDGSIRCCNRLGCSTRFYSMERTQISTLEKGKFPKSSLRSMGSNTLPGSSSKSGKLHGISESATETLENSNTKSSSRTQKQINRQWEPGNRDPSSGSSIRDSVASRNTSQTNKHASQGAGSGSDSGRDRRVDVVTKRSSDGASSSTRGKSMSASSRHRGLSAPGLSLSEGLMSQQASRKAGNQPTSRAAATGKARTPEGPSGRTRLRLSEQEDHSSRSLSVPIVTSTVARPQLNMEGIAEVLLALERVGQNEELTYEQLLALETNFSFDLVFYDQHRGMRLDIDDMSYEELLSLEEKMGTVSTALSEEALSRCLKRSIYALVSLVPGITGCRDEDTKCSICQEEYAVGVEVGKLACEHRYHVACINQWLRQKNWCPICKASACPS